MMTMTMQGSMKTRTTNLAGDRVMLVQLENTTQ